MVLTLHQGNHGHVHGSLNASSVENILSDSDKEKLTLTTFDIEQGNERTTSATYGGLSINESGIYLVFVVFCCSI